MEELLTWANYILATPNLHENGLTIIQKVDKVVDNGHKEEERRAISNIDDKCCHGARPLFSRSGGGGGGKKVAKAADWSGNKAHYSGNL